MMPRCTLPGPPLLLALAVAVGAGAACARAQAPLADWLLAPSGLAAPRCAPRAVCRTAKPDSSAASGAAPLGGGSSVPPVSTSALRGRRASRCRKREALVVCLRTSSLAPWSSGALAGLALSNGLVTRVFVTNASGAAVFATYDLLILLDSPDGESLLRGLSPDSLATRRVRRAARRATRETARLPIHKGVSICVKSDHKRESQVFGHPFVILRSLPLLCP